MIPDSRPMSYSRGEITTLVMPHMQNILGDLFGGDLMALVDQVAAVAAIRHAGGPAVTRSIHRLDFHRSIGGLLVTCLRPSTMSARFHGYLGGVYGSPAPGSGATPTAPTSSSSRSTS
jgi:acyl-CoA hydrolase